MFLCSAFATAMQAQSSAYGRSAPRPQPGAQGLRSSLGTRPVTGQQPARVTGIAAAPPMVTRPAGTSMATAAASAVSGQNRSPSYKYTSNMRNPPQTVPLAQPSVQQVQQPSVNIKGHEPLTPSMLAAAQPSEQKQMLGERLYPLIQMMHMELAGKITGMLLEIDNSELLHMLEHHESLKSKVRHTKRRLGNFDTWLGCVPHIPSLPRWSCLFLQYCS